MARPQKEGLDYFPHDTDAVNDEKLEALRALYGNDGYAFFFILLERIYRSPNAEIDISDAETLQILARKVSVTQQLFSEMMQTALKWGCFDKISYEKRGLLTSNGVKKRASPVIEKRANMRLIYNKDRVSTPVPDAETTPETPQSKVKKSTYKEEHIYIILFNLWNDLKIITHKKLTSDIKRAIDNARKDYSEEEVEQAMRNYAVIVKGAEYYFNHRWTLAEFLSRRHSNNIERFLDFEVAKSNFQIKDKGGQGGAHRRGSTKLPPRDGYTKPPPNPELDKLVEQQRAADKLAGHNQPE